MKEYGMNETRSVLGVICSAYDSFFEAEKKDCGLYDGT